VSGTARADLGRQPPIAEEFEVVNAPAPYGARRPPPTESSYGHGAADDWSQPTSVRAGSGSQQSGSGSQGPGAGAPYDGRVGAALPRPKTRERGLPGWAALLVLLAIAGVGGLIDTASGSQVRGGFNVGIIVASIVAMLVVRRSAMFPVVIAPPLVYSLASASMLYLRSGGLKDKKVLLDGAANWLVYGFPAIAAATAAVLIIAGIRLITHR
jgi:hypothetical protein